MVVSGPDSDGVAERERRVPTVAAAATTKFVVRGRSSSATSDQSTPSAAEAFVGPSKQSMPTRPTTCPPIAFRRRRQDRRPLSPGVLERRRRAVGFDRQTCAERPHTTGTRTARSRGDATTARTNLGVGGLVRCSRAVKRGRRSRCRGGTTARAAGDHRRVRRLGDRSIDPRARATSSEADLRAEVSFDVRVPLAGGGLRDHFRRDEAVGPTSSDWKPKR